MNLQLTRSSLKSAFAVALALLFLLPVSIIGGDFKQLPIDIIPSDLIMLFTLIVYLLLGCGLNKKLPLFQVTYVFVFYMLILVLVTIITNSNIQPMYSFVKFAKVFLAMGVGYIISQKYGMEASLRALSHAAFLYIFLYGVSEFFYHKNYLPRLGAQFFNWDVYGFPNSSASYIVFILCISLAVKRTFVISGISIIVASTLAVGSLSRAAILMLLLALAYYYLSNLQRRIGVVLIIIFLSMLSKWFDPISALGLEAISDGVIRRYYGAVSSGDLSNGRFGIFTTTLELFQERPFFGYGFVSFSNFSDYGTPHNQYLEVLFKTGMVGFLFFITFLAFSLNVVIKGSANLPSRFNGFTFPLFVILILLGNFVQPNISSSPTGNLLFLIFGIFSARPYLKTDLEPVKVLGQIEV